MSTRRPNVPRAGRPARNDGGSGAVTSTGGSGAGPDSSGGSGVGADVLRPDFGRKDESEPGFSATGEPGFSATGEPGFSATGEPGFSATVDPSKPRAGAEPEARAKPSSKSGTAGAQRPADGGSGHRVSSHGPSKSKVSRLSAAARRAHERESAKYSVRQPVIGWAKDESTADGGARTKGGSANGAASGAGNAAPVPAKSFSGRLLALGVVLVTITVLLAPTVKTYLEQRAEINALQDEIAVQQDERAELKHQLARWEDPAYIKQQARNRLFLVMPGETRYLVMGADGAQDASNVPASPEGDEDVPWVDALFESIKRSGTD
ncbi:FtsB family cell division protein [Arthrobacter monumenti]